MNDLQGLEQDILLDAFSIGTGDAEAELSELTHSNIVISVFQFNILSRAKLTEILNQTNNKEYIAINQSFDSEFSGCSSFLISQNQSCQLLTHFIKDQENSEQLVNREEEVLREIGNVILNSGINAFSELFELAIKSSLPQYYRGDFESIQANCQHFNSVDEKAYCVSIDMQLDDVKINAYIMYLLKLNSQNELARLISEYINRIYPAQNIS